MFQSLVSQRESSFCITKPKSSTLGSISRLMDTGRSSTRLQLPRCESEWTSYDNFYQNLNNFFSDSSFYGTVPFLELVSLICEIDPPHRSFVRGLLPALPLKSLSCWWTWRTRRWATPSPICLSLKPFFTPRAGVFRTGTSLIRWFSSSIIGSK